MDYTSVFYWHIWTLKDHFKPKKWINQAWQMCNNNICNIYEINNKQTKRIKYEKFFWASPFITIKKRMKLKHGIKMDKMCTFKKLRVDFQTNSWWKKVIHPIFCTPCYPLHNELNIQFFSFFRRMFSIRVPVDFPFWIRFFVQIIIIIFHFFQSY